MQAICIKSQLWLCNVISEDQPYLIPCIKKIKKKFILVKVKILLLKKMTFTHFDMGDKFKLTWHTFSFHGQQLLRNLFESQEFTDVTLISDDQHQYKVHKFILSACSTSLKRILSSNPFNTSIYLRGIHHEELESILQFIYFGEATLYHERINEFLNVAKNLDIKEIGKNVIHEVEDSKYVNDNQSADQEDLVASDANQSKVIDEDQKREAVNDNQSFNPEASVVTDDEDHEREAVKHKQSFNQEVSAAAEDEGQERVATSDEQSFNQEASVSSDEKQSNEVGLSNRTTFQAINSDSIQSDNKPYKCHLCDYQASYKHHLKLHVQSKHEDIKYPCQQCDYFARQPSNLNQHIRTKHEGIRYSCNKCDYEATLSNHLQKHVLSKHEGLKYPCQKCDYQAKDHRYLKNHINSKHEGIKYPCGKCDYKAKHPSYLQDHIKWKHEGIRYSCQQCCYEATTKRILRRHIRTKHEL